MHELGLTGGIGSGKSTVGAGLVSRGGALVDADAIVRELQEPGEPVFAAMVAHFGEKVVGDDGRLNRAAVAAIVFSDADELAALNAMVHPAVDAEMSRRRAALADGDRPVILDIPLMIDSLLKAADSDAPPKYGQIAGIIVVDVPTEVCVARLVEHRGFTEADALARIASQVDREARLERADFVLDNSGSLADLESQLDACWTWIQSLN